VIPRHASDVDALVGEAGRQSREVEELVSGLSEEALVWRPDQTRWSVTGHLAHLGVLNGRYVESIRHAVASARAAGGPTGDGPYRHPWMAKAFVRAMEPPPKRRTKTFRSMVPDAGAEPGAALTTFLELQDRLVEQLVAARGLDLGRIRFGSPFFRLLRLSLGCALEGVLAHNRRHLWLLHELVAKGGFPRPPF
jgi:hypothetical protein